MEKIVFHFLFKDNAEDIFSKGVNIEVNPIEEKIAIIAEMSLSLFALAKFEEKHPNKIFLGMYAISEMAKLETLQNEQAQKESSRI